MSRILKVIKLGALLLVVALIGVACSPDSGPEDLGPALEEVSVATAIAQTLEAQAMVEAIVQQTIAAQQPAVDPVQPPPAQDPVQPVVDPNAPDLADPNSGIEPIKPVADPNAASGTPQLRVIYSSINVRLGPGIYCRPISALLQDSVVPAKAKNQDGKWFEITLPNGQNGWVADSVTDFVVAADIANVPVSNTPYCAPPPTATATSTTVPTNTPLPTSTTAAPGNTPMPTSTTAVVPTATDPAPVIPSNIQIINNSTTDIWNIFIDLSSDPNWPSSGDRLGTNNFLLVGTQRTFDLPAGEYDMMALDEFDNVVAIETNVNVTGFMQWDIR